MALKTMAANHTANRQALTQLGSHAGREPLDHPCPLQDARGVAVDRLAEGAIAAAATPGPVTDSRAGGSDGAGAWGLPGRGRSSGAASSWYELLDSVGEGEGGSESGSDRGRGRRRIKGIKGIKGIKSIKSIKGIKGIKGKSKGKGKGKGRSGRHKQRKKRRRSSSSSGREESPGSSRSRSPRYARAARAFPCTLKAACPTSLLQYISCCTRLRRARRGRPQAQAAAHRVRDPSWPRPQPS